MLVYLIHKLTCMQFSRYNHWLISLSLTAYMKYKPMGLSGLEPPTSRLSGVRSNQLSYKPKRPVTKFKLRLRLAFIKCHDMPRTKFSLRCRSSSLSTLAMEMKRFELSTPCLQGRCSPN